MSSIDDGYLKLARDLGDNPVTVSITIRLHQSGALSVEAPLGDPAFCYRMLDEARDAIKRQSPIIPACDVDSRAKERYDG